MFYGGDIWPGPQSISLGWDLGQDKKLGNGKSGKWNGYIARNDGNSKLNVGVDVCVEKTYCSLLLKFNIA